MKLVIASNNAHKVREIKEILGAQFHICSQREAGMDLEVVEDGATFAQNAIKKATETLSAAPATFDAALADDSGLIVDALDGAPGVYSARFAGEGHDDAANNRKLLALMEQVPDPQRTCRFACAIALARRGREPLCVTGYCEGKLLRTPQGEGGFGYDPLFLYGPAGLSFAQLGAEEKNAVSHRRQALEALSAALLEERRCE